jgi:hypothetical protein
VTGATIEINDDLGNSAMYEETSPGVYLLDPQLFVGVPGRTYHVEITLANGESFCSTPQMMPSPINADQAYFEIDRDQNLSSSGVLVEQTVVNIFIDTPLQNDLGDQPGLRWTVEEVYSYSDLSCHSFYDAFATTCYFNVPFDESEVLIFKAEEGVQERLEGYKVRTRLLAPNDEFVEKHYFSVHQYTLSPATFEYWQQVRAVTSQTGNLFDVPPAAVTGNIFATESGLAALGFFEVSGRSIVRTFTTPFLIGGNRIVDTCPIRRSQVVQDKCCFCWLVDQPENRVGRPDYW